VSFGEVKHSPVSQPGLPDAPEDTDRGFGRDAMVGSARAIDYIQVNFEY
jgi:hypothetical protein